MSDFTDLHSEKKSNWKFRVNGIVSVTGTRVNGYQICKHGTGLRIRVRIGKLFSLFLKQNICCGYSKEPSH